MKNFNLDENENYSCIADNILEKSNIKNYKRYIGNMFMNREINLSTVKKVDNDFMKYSNCLRCLCEGNYCQL